MSAAPPAPSSVPPSFQRTSEKTKIIAPDGFIDVESWWINGTTLHLHGNNLYRYKGYPRCFTEDAHSSATHCLENYKAVHSCISTGTFLNIWIHYPKDGSDAWIQKDFVCLLNPQEFHYARIAPSQVIFLPRYYATLMEAYMLFILEKLKTAASVSTEQAMPKLSTRSVVVWLEIIVNSISRVIPVPKIVLCPHIKPDPPSDNYVTWDTNVLYQKQNQCPNFPYLVMSRYPNYSMAATEEPAYFMMKRLNQFLPRRPLNS